MVRALRPSDNAIILRFGGGVHSKASPDEINERECADGRNFILDLENRNFQPREPFDLVFTAPNGSEIRGFVNLRKIDGTISFLAQAGDTVYEWDGVGTLSAVNTVSSAAKLRGHRINNYSLDDLAIITDIAGSDVVMQWDGSSLDDVTFTNENGNAFGTFKAKYAYVQNERVVFANITEAGGAFPNLVVGSKRSDYTQITVNDRPSSALSPEDPFYLVAPDLRAVNGLVEAFGVVAVSTEGGSMHRIEGQSSEDFSIESLFAESASYGAESVVYAGNDILYGRQGRIESLAATDQFGDVESDDLTLPIGDRVQGYTGWTAVYNSRLQRVYWFPDGKSEVLVLHKPIIGTDFSPWSIWTTEHEMAFLPSAVMSMLDPSDGLEYVFMGDDQGNVYRLEGSGSSGDGGQSPVVTERLSKLYSAQLDEEYYDFEGWVKYRKGTTITLTIDLEFHGISGYTTTVTVPLKGVEYDSVWRGFYWGGGYYWGVRFQGRFVRTTFDGTGQSDSCQVRAKVESSDTFEIAEIGFRLTGSSKG